ncbi:hypothetical protein AAFG07_11280 [Bradyrhizobium sp. B097]|uniref:hypothetical protein n=1 Tax=Bradyrhizobium sp. B097 TaxID=3140244 RepID=UPI003182D410
MALDAAGGKFFSEFIYAEWEYFCENARYFGGKNYIIMLQPGNSDGRLLVIDEDLSPASATLLPLGTFPVRTNDDCASALSINLGEIKTGNLFYGSTEPSEPRPTWLSSSDVRNNGHSVWYSFVAPATTTYTLSVSDLSGNSTFSVDA